MIPVVTAEQMRAADAAALSAIDDGWTFIRRAGHATAGVARTMMSGAYGRRVVVIAGKGNNGNDGRVAAERLAEWGASVRIVDAAEAHGKFIDGRTADLVIDAAYGIGFRGTWSPPIVFDVPVLAVDIPSGLDATTGVVNGGVLVADRTVTFAALKSGMVLGDGPSVCGEIDIVDVGIPLEPGAEPDTYLVEASDVRRWLPPRDRQSHKWSHGLRVVAGSPGMTGAASLVCASAMRAGAGIVHLSTRGDVNGAQFPTEVVHRALPHSDWADFLSPDARRFGALVIGPGLGRGDDVALELREVLANVALPAVVDGDGIAESVDPRGVTALSRAAPPPPFSRPTTESSPPSAETRQVPTVWAPPVTWRPGRTARCCARDPPPSWRAPVTPPTWWSRATNDSQPQAAVTFSPASSVRSSPAGWAHRKPRLRPRSSTARLGPACPSRVRSPATSCP